MIGYQLIKALNKQIIEPYKKQFNPNIKKLLNKYGNERIEQIIIYRKPIDSYIKTLLNTISLGQINVNLKRANYDKLFHLFMIVKFGNNWFMIEKNQRINIVKINTIDNMVEHKEIDMSNTNITMNILFNNTIKSIGNDNFFIYKSDSWNCQNFILNILKYNNLLNDELINFILQDTEKIFNKLGYLSNISNKLTNIASSIDVISKGGKLNRWIYKNNI